MTNVFLVYQFMVTATFYYPSFLVESLLDLTTKPNRKMALISVLFKRMDLRDWLCSSPERGVLM